MHISSDAFIGYAWQLAMGAVITLELFASGFILALLLGTAIGIITLSRNVVIQAAYRVYASIITGVPSLLSLIHI